MSILATQIHPKSWLNHPVRFRMDPRRHGHRVKAGQRTRADFSLAAFCALLAEEEPPAEAADARRAAAAGVAEAEPAAPAEPDADAAGGELAPLLVLLRCRLGC